MVNYLRFKQLLVMTALLLSSIPLFAYDFEVDGIYYNKLSENTVEVTSNSNLLYFGDVVIPTTTNYNDITYTVTSIGNYAFAWCSELTSITIPDRVTSIGGSAFSGCSGLTSITIPDGVTSIGESAFFNCKALTSMEIPKGVTSIENDLFYGCSGLTSLTISDAVTSIGKVAFGYCSGLTSFKIPEGVTSIGNSAFIGCSGLTSINIPDGVTSIGDAAFEDCIGLTSISIPDGVTAINSNAFEGCNGLTLIKIPDGVTSIGYGAFSGCSSLASIKIPDAVTTIGEYSFDGCSELASMNIPSEVTKIGDYAFHGCSKIKEIFCESENPPTCGTSTFDGISKIYCKVYIPEVSIEKYQEATGWNEFSNLIGTDMGNPNASETCKTPDITFDNNERKLKFSCGTEGATFVCSIKSADIFSNIKAESEIPLAGTYTVTVYATKDDMKKSETTTATLVWVSASIEGNGILTAKADRGVVVSSNGNSINISGTVSGETIDVYNVGGSKLMEVNANDGNTTINGLQSGNVYIVKIGGTKVKVAM